MDFTDHFALDEWLNKEYRTLSEVVSETLTTATVGH
jgi:hypothetical protein